MSERKEMIKYLKDEVVPVLRNKGFKGTFPHFRRPTETHIDLMTFQFDKWGGGFVIELAVCPLTGVTLYWGKQIAPSKVTAHDVNKRYRLGSSNLNSDYWFRYDEGVLFGNKFLKVTKSVIDKLELAEQWFNELSSEINFQ
ncbi:DUF4304 domain-containing protein [Acetivibrio cellulolyticus]|uniref:DUF4304 domain-containing protein n=1 Tax=Acetivibrio cellulolyticus TaxID=35830 RepID=UPI0001E2D0E3|nr:DUF4304 domain-containing protein [Acetivibrio cellulolyticus]